ncbi:aminoacyl-histidine dipeptidase [Tepidibacter formicigenes]|jgi:dipeptidase D|uniref:Cytosol non-specific dipeptidase n=1 Tax=Tepidibacter formicigenes DSM 15518 TaxID=1123349 RepID=A0A1M6KRL1_9FIRM|nr:aminoacyl-histidine dipeptidase [Tepidibacter formicigenes]SHJ61534.1 dipeptidase D [Tepidibacter formicigenes DSM 15518]
MSNILANLKPQAVFKYFEEMSQIPRGSGNEKAISDYLVSFAKNHNLDVIQDEALNVIIKKPGTKGYENAPTVILQGHMDMVCEKNKETIHDFKKDSIKLRIEDDFIYATDTTLGADNGIAVAYALAILESNDIPHPPIEVLITTEEETGMGGAMALDGSNLSGKYLINLDSEEEGYLLVSCAGGVRTRQILNIDWEEAKKDLSSYLITIKGLKGGHSGMDIIKQRGNSNKLMGRVLSELSNSFEYFIANINGGAKMNAIPRECETLILTDSQNFSKLKEKIEEFNNIFKNELKTSDPDVLVTVEKSENTYTKVFSKETMDKAIASLVLIPNGIQSMSMDIEGLVESSTNLGVVTTHDNEITFESAVRSSVKSLKYNILNEMNTIANVLGCKLIADSDYPEWEYRKDSKLREICQNVYKEKYQKEAKVIAIHAGLECGLLLEKIPNVDAISLGPDMFDVHTPNEHLSISSTQRTWEYLLDILKAIK